MREGEGFFQAKIIVGNTSLLASYNQNIPARNRGPTAFPSHRGDCPQYSGLTFQTSKFLPTYFQFHAEMAMLLSILSQLCKNLIPFICNETSSSP